MEVVERSFFAAAEARNALQTAKTQASVATVADAKATVAAVHTDNLLKTSIEALYRLAEYHRNQRFDRNILQRTLSF
jgi:hypothetical protein